MTKDEALRGLNIKQIVNGVESFLIRPTSVEMQIFNYSKYGQALNDNTPIRANIHFISLDELLAEIKRRVAQ